MKMPVKRLTDYIRCFSIRYNLDTVLNYYTL